jgi:hypothetical protein
MKLSFLEQLQTIVREMAWRGELLSSYVLSGVQIAAQKELASEIKFYDQSQRSYMRFISRRRSA